MSEGRRQPKKADGRRGGRVRAANAAGVRANKRAAKYVMLYFVGRWTGGRAGERTDD